jgi:hypothetical protein
MRQPENGLRMRNKAWKRAPAAIVLLLAFGAAVQAQPGAPTHPGLPPYEVLAIVRSKGLEPLSRPQRHAGSYTLRAVDSRGREVQVTVDARQARITKIAPLVRPSASGGVQASAPARVAPDGLSPNSRISPGIEGLAAEHEHEGGAIPRTSARRLQALPEVPPLPRPRPQTSSPSSADPVLSKAPEAELPQNGLEE